MPEEFPDLADGEEKLFEDDPLLVEFVWGQIHEEEEDDSRTVQ